MNKYPSIAVVIPAAGIGKRMQTNIPKQYLDLCGKTVLEHTIARFSSLELIDKIVIAISDDDRYIQEILPKLSNKVELVIGGKERADSVLAGLQTLDANQYQWVMVHDAARPCVLAKDIINLVEQVQAQQSGAILASPVRDTMKRSNVNGHISHTVERQNLWHAYTPQMFNTQLLCQAILTQLGSEQPITDEASAMELAGHPVRLVEGSDTNIKITRPQDLKLAEIYLEIEQNEN